MMKRTRVAAWGLALTLVVGCQNEDHRICPMSTARQGNPSTHWRVNGQLVITIQRSDSVQVEWQGSIVYEGNYAPCFEVPPASEVESRLMLDSMVATPDSLDPEVP